MKSCDQVDEIYLFIILLATKNIGNIVRKGEMYRSNGSFHRTLSVIILEFDIVTHPGKMSRKDTCRRQALPRRVPVCLARTNYKGCMVNKAVRRPGESLRQPHSTNKSPRMMELLAWLGGGVDGCLQALNAHRCAFPHLCSLRASKALRTRA